MKRYILILLILMFTQRSSNARTIIISPDKKMASSLAVIVDAVTYDKIGKTIHAYQKALENEGLSAYIIYDHWQHPDSIRSVLKSLYRKRPLLEGAVLIGDIPVPMLRDAQHLTSAFKINQDRYSLQRTSVPSDRFYEDFDLEFTYLRQDTANTLLHYYSLNPDSPQRVQKEIYSGRVLPSERGEEKYDVLRSYLKRTILRKQQPDDLSDAMIATGHGYHSEALSAWEGEAISLREQFPQLYRPGGSLKNYYHSMDTELKDILLKELQTDKLDMVIFHSHGGVESQYLLGDPPHPTIGSQIDAIKFFIRGKLRNARRKNKDEKKILNDYLERYDIPSEWFENVLSDSLRLADSLEIARKDINISDIEKILPGAELIIFDQCFNGAFFQSPYVAGEYVFSQGTAIACLANSVNVLQDIWANEFIGLLSRGARLGLMHRLNPYLESHIIGDPTFYFYSDTRNDMNALLLNGNASSDIWKSLMNNPSPPIRNLAISMLTEEAGNEFREDLISKYRNESSYIVRSQLLKTIAGFRGSDLTDMLILTIEDPYEFIRRKSAVLMGDLGSDIFIPRLIKSIFTDPSDRVRFAAKSALQKIEVIPEKIDGFVEETASDLWASEMKEYLLKNASWQNERFWNEILSKARNDTIEEKKRITAIRTLRNYRFHALIPEMLMLAKDTTQPDNLRSRIIEMLGWYAYSYQRESILKTCSDLINSASSSSAVKREAIKTRIRLASGPNHSLTP